MSELVIILLHGSLRWFHLSLDLLPINSLPFLTFHSCVYRLRASFECVLSSLNKYSLIIMGDSQASNSPLKSSISENLSKSSNTTSIPEISSLSSLSTTSKNEIVALKKKIDLLKVQVSHFHHSRMSKWSLVVRMPSCFQSLIPGKFSQRMLVISVVFGSQSQ